MLYHWYQSYFWYCRIRESSRLEKTFKVTKSDQQPDLPSSSHKPCSLVVCPHCLLNAFRNGDSTFSLNSLFQCLITMSKFFLTCDLNFPWCNLKPHTSHSTQSFSSVPSYYHAVVQSWNPFRLVVSVKYSITHICIFEFIPFMSLKDNWMHSFHLLRIPSCLSAHTMHNVLFPS